MAIIIKKPQIVTLASEIPEEEKVVISQRNTLYDVNAQFTETKNYDAEGATVVQTAAAPPPPEPEKVLYDANAALTGANGAVFTWQQEPVTKQPVEYVVVADDSPPPPPKKTAIPVKWNWTGSFSNIIVTGIFVLALLTGAKTAFDYIQEAESFKKMALTMENLYSSDLTDEEKRSLAFFGSPKEKPAIETSRYESDDLVDIISTRPYYLLGKRKDGKIELRTGGSVGWRTNNPAQFGYGDFAKSTGAIASYSKYAIYPSIKIGIAAIEVYLFSTNIYKDLTIDEAMKKFYENSKDATEVAKDISTALNKSRARTKMSDLNDSQKAKLIKVIVDRETSLKGVTRVFDSMDDFKEKGF